MSRTRRGRTQAGADGSAGTAKLRLPGFRLLAVSEAFGGLEQAVETNRDRGVVLRLRRRLATARSPTGMGDTCPRPAAR